MDILEAKFNSIKRLRKQKLKGFTLIEIVAVITLLMLNATRQYSNMSIPS